MIVILINSFNTNIYIEYSKQLYRNIKNIIDVQYIVIIVYGGCERYGYKIIDDTCIHVYITENISDHNVYPGYMYLSSVYDLTNYSTNCHLIIHDSCKLAESFRRQMNTISKITFSSEDRIWVFAHYYGLCNIGICSQSFIFHRYKDFENIDFIKKEDSIILEQGCNIHINGKTIQPLIFYSHETLSSFRKNTDTIDILDYDSISINFQSHVDDDLHFILYMSSIGIYKLPKLCYCIACPIWNINIKSLNDRYALYSMFKDKPNGNHWYPLKQFSLKENINID